MNDECRRRREARWAARKAARDGATGAIRMLRGRDELCAHIAQEIRDALASGWHGIAYQFIDTSDYKQPDGTMRAHYLLLTAGHAELAEKAAEMHRGRLPTIRFLLTEDLRGTEEQEFELGRREFDLVPGYGVIATRMGVVAETASGFKGLSDEALRSLAELGIKCVLEKLRESSLAASAVRTKENWSEAAPEFQEPAVLSQEQGQECFEWIRRRTGTRAAPSEEDLLKLMDIADSEGAPGHVRHFLWALYHWPEGIVSFDPPCGTA